MREIRLLSIIGSFLSEKKNFNTENINNIEKIIINFRVFRRIYFRFEAFQSLF
jgi:hypothetical protein